MLDIYSKAWISETQEMIYMVSLKDNYRTYWRHLFPSNIEVSLLTSHSNRFYCTFILGIYSYYLIVLYHILCNIFISYIFDIQGVQKVSESRDIFYINNTVELG